jgi:leucyl aminopeptidase (aminopeptidase T)
MEHEIKIKMFKDVFAPKSGEKILFLVDTPHDNIHDNEAWQERRAMTQDWYTTFKEMGATEDFTVEMREYPATGTHNSPIPQEILDAARQVNLVIAMTEFSASSSLKPICNKEDTITRGASMPSVEKRMEQTAFTANYADVQRYATAIKHMLNEAVAADVSFSTGDSLHIDLRNRGGLADGGSCSKTGQFINFPSGEGYIAPYEAAPEEATQYGASKTEGIWPVDYEGEQVKYVVKHNRIVEIIGDGPKADEMRRFFAENETRKNVAELGIGCNPKAVVTGNVLEDEKVGGLHIAYGMSSHLGGTVDSDMHQDICYPKHAPIEATSLRLINRNGTTTELIQDAELRYELLK